MTTISVDTCKPVVASSINPEFIRRCREAAARRRKDYLAELKLAYLAEIDASYGEWEYRRRIEASWAEAEGEL
jgi:hypothetical protein